MNCKKDSFYENDKKKLIEEINKAKHTTNSFGEYRISTKALGPIPAKFREDEEIVSLFKELVCMEPEFKGKVYHDEIEEFNTKSAYKNNLDELVTENESLFEVDNVEELLEFINKNPKYFLDLSIIPSSYAAEIPYIHYDITTKIPFIIKVDYNDVVKDDVFNCSFSFVDIDEGTLQISMSMNTEVVYIEDYKICGSEKKLSQANIYINKVYKYDRYLYLEVIRTIDAYNRVPGLKKTLSNLGLEYNERFEPFKFRTYDNEFSNIGMFYAISKNQMIEYLDVLYIPERHRWTMPVDIIDKRGFDNLSLKKLIIPHRFLPIGVEAFYNSDIESIEFIGDDIKRIDICKGAFQKNSKLIGLILPEGVQKIEANVFAECENLKYVVISSSVSSIAKNAFAKCPNLTIYTTRKTQTKKWDEKMCDPKTKIIYANNWKYDSNGVPIAKD